MLVQYSQTYNLAPLANAVVTHGTALPRLAAPTGLAASNVTASTIPLAANSVSGAAGYRFQLATNAAFTAGLLTSPTQNTAFYTFTGLSASTPYYARVVAIGNGTTSTDSLPSATLPVTTTTGTAPADVVFTPAAADYSRNILTPTTDPAGTGYSTNADLNWSTNATGMVVNMTIEAQDGTSNGAGVLLAGNHVQYLTGPAGTADYAVDLSGVSGTKAVQLLASAQIRMNNDTGRRLGGIINSVKFTGGTSTVKVMPAKKAGLVVMVTDSIWQGYSLAVPTRDGATAQLRGLLADYDVINYGWSGASLNNGYSTSSQQNAVAASINAAAAGYTGPKAFWMELGTNDYWAQGISASAAAGYALGVLVALRALDTSWRMILQGPLGRFDHTGPNAAGSTLQDYSDAFYGLVNGRPWIQFVNALNWLYQNQFSDDLHPNAQGAPVLAGNVRDIILGNTGIPTGNIPTTFDGTNYVKVLNSEQFAPTALGGFVRWLPNGETAGNGAQELAAKAFSVPNPQPGVAYGVFGLYYLGGKIWLTTFGTNGQYYNLSIAASPTAGNVYNIGYSVSTSAIRLVVNSVIVADVGNPFGTTNDPIVFGGVRDGGTQTTVNRAEGTIANVSVFNVELSQQALLDVCAANCVLTQAQITNGFCVVYSPLTHAANETRMNNLATPSWPLNIVPVAN